MKLNNISLPYPVLGISDDIVPSLDDNCIKITPSEDIECYYFDFELSFDNNDIIQFIKNGYAEYTCEIDCVKTVFRKSLSFSENKFRIALSRKDVLGGVDFNCYVSVKRPIYNYSNSCFNEDYNGLFFNMEPGDILVGFPSYHIDTDIRYDRLQAAGSFLEIVKGSESTKYTSFEFDHDKIQIILPPGLYTLFDNNNMGSEFDIIMQSSMAYNALTCALYEINNVSPELKWVRAIMTRLKTEDDLKNYLNPNDDEKIEIENVPELAIHILKDPYNRLIHYLSDYKIKEKSDDNN